MAALAPPHNNAGVPLPALPHQPAVLSDVTNAGRYIERLLSSQKAGHNNQATDEEIGRTEVYKSAIIFSVEPGPNVAPIWFANLAAAIDQVAANVALIPDLAANANQIPDIAAAVQLAAQNAAQIPQLVATTQHLTGEIAALRLDINRLFDKTNELPILLANSQAGNRGVLYNPTALANGWAPPLAHPNPATRDELMTFTIAQCVASAQNLGLPHLPGAPSVVERRRQIASRLGYEQRDESRFSPSDPLRGGGDIDCTLCIYLECRLNTKEGTSSFRKRVRYVFESVLEKDGARERVQGVLLRGAPCANRGLVEDMRLTIRKTRSQTEGGSTICTPRDTWEIYFPTKLMEAPRSRFFAHSLDD
ncbi:hypothetical protein CVT26_011133 [Gymnopilus dilepis]|uniref:Uncharacterized protein n=1 Tax=Gymnopilus dilepis TaxID=231916 RepID=A0A409VYU3_9AGAR|nr:hypothetical protein CVT26_011133 [Gymnopilus dilepis]